MSLRSGVDGNIYQVLRDLQLYLGKERLDEFVKIFEKVTNANSYEEALKIIEEAMEGEEKCH